MPRWTGAVPNPPSRDSPLSLKKMLPGDRSRWTMQHSFAVCTAPATRRRRASAVSGPIRPSAWGRSFALGRCVEVGLGRASGFGLDLSVGFGLDLGRLRGVGFGSLGRGLDLGVDLAGLGLDLGRRRCFDLGAIRDLGGLAVVQV